MMTARCGFNLVNTKNNMNINLNMNHRFNILYGTVDVDKKYGIETFKIRNVTDFEECNKDLMSKLITKEKCGHRVDIDVLKHIYESIKTIDNFERFQDDDKFSASFHQEVIAKMDRYLRVIRLAFSELYTYDECTYEFKSLRDVLKSKLTDLDKFVFKTDKGYTLDEKKSEKMDVYGTVKMFVDEFCINPLSFKNGISYDSICKCIHNIYIWVSKIIEAYVVLNVPEHYVISYIIPHNGVNFYECRLSAAMMMSNMIGSIIQYPIKIIPEFSFFDDINDQDIDINEDGVSWDDIDQIIDGYGF